MFKSLKTAASGMDAQQRKLDVTANNIANVSTTGFKASRAEFQELLYTEERAAGNANEGGAPTAIEVGSGVRTAATQKNFTQGTLEATGNPLDIAIEGQGFFQVMRENGVVAYTRAGAFKVDSNGQIVTADGHRMQPDISLPEDTSSITVQRDGRIMITVGDSPSSIEAGRIELANFANPAGLRSLGRNLFEANDASGLPQIGQPGQSTNGTLSQGYLEGSNVQVTEEMISMIVAQRAYEINSKVIRTVDEMLRTATNIR